MAKSLKSIDPNVTFNDSFRRHARSGSLDRRTGKSVIGDDDRTVADFDEESSPEPAPVFKKPAPPAPKSIAPSFERGKPPSSLATPTPAKPAWQEKLKYASLDTTGLVKKEIKPGVLAWIDSGQAPASLSEVTGKGVLPTNPTTFPGWMLNAAMTQTSQ